jgi:hypothetical protein
MRLSGTRWRCASRLPVRPNIPTATRREPPPPPRPVGFVRCGAMSLLTRRREAGLGHSTPPVHCIKRVAQSVVPGCLRASHHAGGSGARVGVVQLAGRVAGFRAHLGADAGDVGGGGGHGKEAKKVGVRVGVLLVHACVAVLGGEKCVY